MTAERDSQINNKILIVDPDLVLREFYERVLANLGYDAISVASGKEALSLLQTPQFACALVILDMFAPIASDWKVLTFIRATPGLHDKPVIAITDAALGKAAIDKLHELCNDVILKGDFDMTRFSTAIRQVL